MKSSYQHDLCYGGQGDWCGNLITAAGGPGMEAKDWLSLGVALTMYLVSIIISNGGIFLSGTNILHY